MEDTSLHSFTFSCVSFLRRHIRHIKYIKFDIVLSPLNETINYISKKKAKMVPPRSPFTDAIDGGMSDKVVKPKIKKHKLPLLGLSRNAFLSSSLRFDTSIARTQQKKVSRTKFYTFRITSYHVYDSLSLRTLLTNYVLDDSKGQRFACIDRTLIRGGVCCVCLR